MTNPALHLSHPKYRPDIDGLRAIAVLSVVAFHAFPSWMKGGFIGVDVFFVISGFLISTIIFENLDKGTFSFSEFYARRIKRIYPALLIVLTASIVFGWFSLLADEYKQLGKHTMAATGFISNFVLWSEAGYFDNSAETKPLLHLWSLGIEEQFYFIWPLLCWFFWRMKFYRLALVVGFILASFFLNLYTIKIDGVATFYSPITRFWELLFGSLLSYFSLHHKITVEEFQKNTILSNGASFLGFLILVSGFLLINKDASFPGYWALIPVIGSVLIILSGPFTILSRTILTNKVIVWFGLISFPLYLWHWPLLTFLKIIEGGLPDSSLRLAAVFLSIFLAWLTYAVIETRVRKSNGYSLVKIFLLISFILFLSGLAIFCKNGLVERKAVTTSDFTQEVRQQFTGPFWSYTKNDTCLTDYPYKDQDSLSWWFCMKSSTRQPTILLLGNSFANQLYPGFAKNRRLSKQTILSIGTCAVGSDGSGEVTRSPCFGSRAVDQAKFIDDIIKKTPSLKFVIMDGLARDPSGAYIDRVVQRINFLESRGIKVIVFTPHIKPDFNPKACFKSPFRQKPDNCVISAEIRGVLLHNFNPLLQAIKQSHPNVLIFEQNDVFCDRSDNKCSFIKNGLPLHRDEGHISEYASILLQDYFTKWATANIPSILDDGSKSEK